MLILFVVSLQSSRQLLCAVTRTRTESTHAGLTSEAISGRYIVVVTSSSLSPERNKLR